MLVFCRLSDGAAGIAGKPGERGRALPHGCCGGSPGQGGGGLLALQNPLQAPGVAAPSRVHQPQRGQWSVGYLCLYVLGGGGVMHVCVHMHTGV